MATEGVAVLLFCYLKHLIKFALAMTIWALNSIFFSLYSSAPWDIRISTRHWVKNLKSSYFLPSTYEALQFYRCNQARIHTGFHRFTEIGQILHNKYIFSKKPLTFKVDIWKMVWTVSKYPVWMTQKPRKGDFGELKSQKFPGGACPKTSLEVGNRSVFILDPHLVTLHNTPILVRSIMWLYY